MHTSTKIKTRYKYKVQYTSIKQNKYIPKKLEVQTSMELYKRRRRRKHEEKIRSSENYHLVASLNICWCKLMDKRTCAAKATAKQGGIERRNVDVAHIQSFCEYCAICKLLRSPISAQYLPPTTSTTGLRAS